MSHFEEVAEATDAVRDYIILHHDSFPQHLKERLHALTRTGAASFDMITTFVRAVYANREAFPAEALGIAAGVADQINLKGFSGRLEGRADKMANALRRDAGESSPPGQTWPAEADDPDVDHDLLPPPAPPEPEPAPPTPDEPAARRASKPRAGPKHPK